ncbi:SDR family NAD(P)-dependent oxidoreductase [Streptomyces sp. GMR22]|uniref:SDR family NAD(P)-dependent oxidoreductase n=1 Tax=Streptomyces sp. GMR22 TaxID=2759524 RepID=UPI0015FA062B|nr:SDR family oxidoreductase [Streptomyces sp. GMR22]MBA6437036.1 SDR family oxidoreductase [Streptomyces sp. GMR22]
MRDLQGATVVVTGAGRGIGAALARRFAAEGARVAVNDRHLDRAEAVAAEIGGTALPGNASDALVPTALRLLGGTVDIYCANAGIAPAGGPELPDEQWEAAWDVNLMAHVRAARDLLPHWLERGRGRFVSIASAAALTTMIGAAPYAVSKHAALAFAEWLSVTYRHRGIDVHAVCPRGVRTAMRRQAGATRGMLLTSVPIGPDEVAEAVLKGIADERFLILPHPEVAEHAASRGDDRERWLCDTNQLQRRQEARRQAG